MKFLLAVLATGVLGTAGMFIGYAMADQAGGAIGLGIGVVLGLLTGRWIITRSRMPVETGD